MAFRNRFRLPLSLFSPQFLDEQEKFIKANGEIVTLSAIVRKQYDVRTDYMPEKWHERLKIALAHDNVNIEEDKYHGGVVQEGAYSIDWPDFLNYPTAPASFKVDVNGFAARNTNCGTCEEFNQVVCNDDDMGTIEEDTEYSVPVLYNDAICCSPFEISIVVFNSTYLLYCNVVGNTLVMKTKTGIPNLDNVELVRYRVTCDNGMFDEAEVRADVNGTIPTCGTPRFVTVENITSTTADVTWSNFPTACSYDWLLFLASDLGTPVQSGNVLGSPLNLTGLNPSTDYVFQIRTVCCNDTVSGYIVRNFTTLPPEETQICGRYELTMTQTCGNPGFYVDLQYLDCNDTYQMVTVYYLSGQVICLKQTEPGAPVYITMTYSNAPPECDPGFLFNYIEPC